MDVMVRIQIRLPERLHEEAKRVSREREISLAEVVRRGLEHMIRVHPLPPAATVWEPPQPRALGTFRRPVKEWRMLANDPAPSPKE